MECSFYGLSQLSDTFACSLTSSMDAWFVFSVLRYIYIIFFLDFILF
uniref:Uncharacterized protein n=1 Tax=Anguilla anguilla TaxID=7936 RepID=A0A0E9U8M9_ANGAN